MPSPGSSRAQLLPPSGGHKRDPTFSVSYCLPDHPFGLLQGFPPAHPSTPEKERWRGAALKCVGGTEMSVTSTGANAEPPLGRKQDRSPLGTVRAALGTPGP